MDQDELEKSSYGAFERFLYIFFIPILFTLILSGVLLSLFGYNVKDTVLRIGNSIPLVNKVIPDPAEQFTRAGTTDLDLDASSVSERVGQLTKKIEQKETELQQLLDSGAKKDQTIKELQDEIKELETKLANKTQNADQYEEQIKNLAALYADMTPSKSAAILENLTMPELVLVLSKMNADNRVGVLEKMDPKIAADASIQLKDIIPVKDRELAALQARLDLNARNNPSNAKLSINDLGQTFAGMAPKSAAAVLIELASLDENKVLGILSVMENQARSQIIASMSDISKENAAKITAKLGK